jgi:hypothetical protein
MLEFEEETILDCSQGPRYQRCHLFQIHLASSFRASLTCTNQPILSSHPVHNPPSFKLPQMATSLEQRFISRTFSPSAKTNVPTARNGEMFLSCPGSETCAQIQTSLSNSPRLFGRGLSFTNCRSLM